MLVESSKINKTKASLINVFFVYGSSVVLIINSILLVPFYLNYMNLSDYGAWLTAVAVINVVMIIDPGISTVSSQRLSKSFTENSDKDFHKIFLSTLLTAICFCFLILFTGFIVLSYVPIVLDYEDPLKLLEFNQAMKIYVVAISCGSIYSVLSSFLQALLKTFIDNTINFICILTSPFIIVISLMNGLGLISLALGVLVPTLLRIVLFTITISFLWSRYIQERFFNFSNVNILLLFKDVKFLYLRKFSTITSENLETAVAGVFFSTEIAAFISIIKRLFIAIQMFSTGIAMSTYTSLSHVFAGSDKPKLKNAVDKTVYSFQLVHLFGTSLILANVGPLIFIWLGEDLFFDYSFIILMALNVFFLAKVNLFNTILYTSGNYKSVAYVSIVESMIRILLTYILLRSFDLFGMPLAGILSSLLVLIYLAKLIQDKTGNKVLELLYPGSGFEFLIYAIAFLVGYYNSAQVDLFSNGTNIFLITLVLTCLIFLSKKVRTLGQQLINAVK